MALSKWSVRLSLEEREAGPISSVMVYALQSDVHGMTIGRRAIDQADEPGAFTVEIDGADPDDARVRAQHLLGELQRRANITVRQAPVIWVARLSDDHPSSLRFLSEAESLIGNEHNEMAVVAAQIHLEVQVRVLVEAAVKAGSKDAPGVVLDERRVWSPHDRFVQAILAALFDVAVKDYPGGVITWRMCPVEGRLCIEVKRSTKTQRERPWTRYRASGSGSTQKRPRSRSNLAACLALCVLRRLGSGPNLLPKPH